MRVLSVVREVIRRIPPFACLLLVAFFAGFACVYFWTNPMFTGSAHTWLAMIPLAVSWAFKLMVCIPCAVGAAYFLWTAIRVITLRADPDDITSSDGGTS